MDFTPLSPAQRESFAEDGYLVVRNALDPETNQAVLEACDRQAAAFLGKGQIWNKPWYNDLDFRPGLLEEEALFNLVSQSSTVPLVVQLLSPNIHLHSTALTYKRPENPDHPPYRRGWHRDIRIPRDLGHENLPIVGIKVCYCLTDFDQDDSGMTIMARRSHLRQEPLRIPEEGIDPPDLEVVDIQLNAGDALLFENRIFHTATPNRSDKVAKRIIYGYAYRWMRPEVYLDVPNPALLKKADPVTRQLIGGYRDIDTPPWALQDWARKHGVMPKSVPWFVKV
ncbi:MAG: phytanoyl-CoA dioxygenase family protein [Bacteroidia bacterium]|nr:phytanoyl-CoA dioxygenase family protein [Bacteroidia bacterium]